MLHHSALESARMEEFAFQVSADAEKDLKETIASIKVLIFHLTTNRVCLIQVYLVCISIFGHSSGHRRNSYSHNSY